MAQPSFNGTPEVAVSNDHGGQVTDQGAASGVQRPPLDQSSGDGSVRGMFQQLSGNTALLYAGGAYVAAFLTLRAGRVFSFLRRQMLVDLEIPIGDPSYRWFLKWMTAHQRAQFANAEAAITDPNRGGILSRLIQRIKPRVHHLSVQTLASNKPEETRFAHFSFVPGPGKHLIRFGNAFIYVNRERQRVGEGGIMFETVKLTTLYGHRMVFEQILSSAHALTLQAHQDKTIIFTPKALSWDPFGDPKPNRPMDSVVLNPAVKSRILTDIQHFLSAREWYHSRGIPYRRSYLLHGHPGTGKSSFVRALAGHLDFNIAILFLSEKGLTDDRLNHLINTALPPRTIILIEDVDCAFSNRTQSDEFGYTGSTVTFAGLLNALDGVSSSEDRILFMTTNHPERLDRAFIRPGRVDVMEHVGLASEWQIARLWDIHFAEFDPLGEAKERFMQKCREYGKVGRVSTAACQGLFLQCQGDPEGAVERAHLLGSEEEAFPDRS